MNYIIIKELNRFCKELLTGGKIMKKILAVLLCVVIAALAMVPTALAGKNETPVTTANSVEEALKISGDTYPIVFVTGIGQTFSYYLDDASEKVMYLHGEEHHFSTMANLFLLDTEITTIIGDAFETIGDGNMTAEEAARVLTQLKNNKILMDNFGNPADAANFAEVVGQLVKTLLTGKYSVNYDSLCQLARCILKDNIIDENGKLPDYILPSTYECPVSEFDVQPNGEDASSYGKGRFYRDVPCREILQEIGEDKVFCYNYAPFGNLSKISAGLDHLINDVILGEDGYFPDAEKVVLVPMSMGAAMVSQYLYNCEQAGKDPHVARVVSVVGCWNGSDIMADLIERKYVENSKELFYTKWPVVVGNNQTTGTILDVVMHLFHHNNLSRLITDVLGAICDELVLKSPSMLALIPCDRYDAIREAYLTRPGYENVLKELDAYHQVQLHLEERMKMLNEKYGVEFYFISGYGLDLGGGYETYDNSRDNYSFFCFLNSANKVNSDEIIPIQSTAPGTSYVIRGQKFSDEYMKNAEKNGTAKYIDPFSQSIDVSTCYYPDHVWTFYQQVHQLDNNNTALKLAFKIATGEINSVNDCKDTFPQFNDSRDIRNIRGDKESIEKMIAACEGDSQYDAIVAEAKVYVAEADAVLDATINNREEENAFEKKLGAFCSRFGKIIKGEDPDAVSEPSFWDKNGDKIMTAIDTVVYKVLNHWGFPDVSLSLKFFNLWMSFVWVFIPVLNLV